MSHHSQDGTMGQPIKDVLDDDKRRKAIEELMQSTLGPTGKFPDGRVSKIDEGEIKFGIASHSGKVFMDFGKPVHSLGMTPQQAMDLAQMLIKKARDANIVGASKEPLTIEIG